MFQSISWFGGGRIAGFSDDEIRTIVEGAAASARKRMPAVRQEPWRSATPRGKRSLKRKAA